MELTKTTPVDQPGPSVPSPLMNGPNGALHPHASDLTITWMDDYSYVHIESKPQQNDEKLKDDKQPSADDQASDRIKVSSQYSTPLVKHQRDQPNIEQEHMQIQKPKTDGVGVSGRKPAGRKGQAKPATYTEEDEAVIVEGYMADATFAETAAELGRPTEQGVDHKVRRMIAQGKLQKRAE